MGSFLAENQWIILFVIIWTLPWKVLALWKSARRGQKIWFLIFIFLNTLAILEILYLFVFTREKKQPEENFNDGARIERASKFEAEMKRISVERKILVN